MATIAEQEKVKNMNMEKQLLALGVSGTLTPAPSIDRNVQQALQDKDK